MTSEYRIGLAAGIICAILICLIYLIVKRARTGGKACEFDERQITARGNAYKVGLFTMCGCNFLFAMLSLFDAALMDTYTAMFTSVIIGIGAFVITAIRQDAYLALHENRKRWYILGTCLCIANLIPSIGVILSGNMYRDGKLATTFVSLLLGILWGLIIIVQYLHNRSTQEEEEA